MPGQGVQAPLRGLPDEAATQGRPLLDGPAGLPQRPLDAPVLGLEEGLGGIGVAGPAAEAQEIALLDPPEDAPVVGAGD